MHPVRVIAAMIAGGYASILAAHAIAQVAPPMEAGIDGVVFGPLAVGFCAAVVLALTYGDR